MTDQTFDLVFLQRLGGGTEVLDRDIPASDALRRLQEAERLYAAPGVTVFLRPSGEVDAGDWQRRAEQAEAALEQLRAGMDKHADYIEPKLDSIEDKAHVIGRQLWRADGLATAAAIALHELEQDGTVHAHTRSLLQSAVAAYEAGRTEAAPLDQSALEQLIIAARVAGAKGTWLIRDAVGAALIWTDHADTPPEAWLSLMLEKPHELVILIRVPYGDGGEAGVEFRA